jgi:hypothetical protein
LKFLDFPIFLDLASMCPLNYRPATGEILQETENPACGHGICQNGPTRPLLSRSFFGILLVLPTKRVIHDTGGVAAPLSSSRKESRK